MTQPNNILCLRQGYFCKCATCQIWIDRWKNELEAFAVIDSMMEANYNLFQIYERLRAEHPEILRLHHVQIEKEYIEYKTTRSLAPASLESSEDESNHPRINLDKVKD